ncbi:MAG: lysine 2,3-aminomutase [bacterium]
MKKNYLKIGKNLKSKIYKSYGLKNFKNIPQINTLSEQEQFNIEVVSQVLPFKVNNYVVDELINWDDLPNDPIFHLTFPQKEMLTPHHFCRIANLIINGSSGEEIDRAVNEIRYQLNPHPADQLKNVPMLQGKKLMGIQHKYRETLLFFPSAGQTCHAFCTFCFRWPQFTGMNLIKFAMKEARLLVDYLQQHEEVTDVLFTGGDPLIMKADKLAVYIKPIIEKVPSVKNIRIGSKVLAYWPYRFLTDRDANELLDLFKFVKSKGKHLTLMAHFSHPNELNTNAVVEAIDKIRSTGVNIRTQSPIMHHINDNAGIWSSMWKEQVNLGLIPYYMFVARNTGAQHYFSIPLVESWKIYREAYKRVSGICRTVRGPCMSTKYGKIQILGEVDVLGDRVIGLRFIQGKNPDWVDRLFFTQFNEEAIWLNDLSPAFFEQKFFFETQEEGIKRFDFDYRDIA